MTLKVINTNWEFAILWESFIHQNKQYPDWDSSFSVRNYVPRNFSLKDGDMIEVSVISETARWTGFQIPDRLEFEQEALRLILLFNETYHFSKSLEGERNFFRKDVFFNYSSRLLDENSSQLVLNPDTKAQYPRGEEALYREVQPPTGCDGIVYVLFVVEAGGQLTNYENYFVMGKTNAQVAYSILDRMPKWIPARHDGKPVASQVDLIITT